MHKLILKTATGVAVAGLLVSTMATSAFAATINVSNNGKKSTNTVTAVSNNKNVVKQKSTTVGLTFVSSVANSGNNKVSGNTGGANSVQTGSATSTVNTTVNGGANEAVAPTCGCVETNDVTISDNGKKSVNTVTTVSTNTNVVKQTSTTVAVTAVSSVADTGSNTVKDNTGGTNDVTTDAADSSVTTEVNGLGNTTL